MTNQNRFRYFLYSQSQHKMRTEVEAKLNKEYTPGKVLVNGKWKLYTELSTSPQNIKFADATIVASGNLEDMRYTRSVSKWRIRR